MPGTRPCGTAGACHGGEELPVTKKLDANGRPIGVLLRAHLGNNPDITVNIYAKAGTLEPDEKALLGEAGMRWLRRHLRVDVTLHKPALDRLFTAAGMPGAPRTIASVCRAVGLLDAGGNRLVDWLARSLRPPLEAARRGVLPHRRF